MNGEILAATIATLFASNGAIYLIIKNVWAKKMKVLEYKHLEESDKREHRQQLEDKRQQLENKEKIPTVLLYEQLDVLKIRIIEQVNKDITQAENNAEKQILIDMLKIQCPGCFAAVEAEILKK